LLSSTGAAWLVFAVMIVALLALDLVALARRDRPLTIREATRWSALVVASAFLFGGYVYWAMGPTRAFEYYAGYLVELSLSVDNLFVFILIFQYFGVPAEAKPKVLNWGIIGAALMRGIFVAVGSVALRRFDWLFIVLGVLLLVTAIRMFRNVDEHIEPERNPLVRLVKRVMPITAAYDRSAFFVRSHAGWMATPLLIVVLVVEWTDLVFAIDSIPAIFAITNDPLIVYSSNIFAIVGLRAMFFVLASGLDRFVYLKPGVGLILAFVGVKMILTKWVHLPIQLSLTLIVSVLAGSILLSLLRQRRVPEG